MGFDTPPAAVTPTQRTFLVAVQDLMKSAGLDAPASFTSPSKHTSMAMVSVNKAIDRIWYAALWDWRYRFIFLTMQDTVFLYDLPADFIASGAGVLRPNDSKQFMFINYFDLVRKFPGLAWPDETILAAEGGTFEAEMTTLIGDDATLGGLPTHYTIIGNRMGLFPIPWLANCDADDFAEKDRILVGYYGAFKDLSATTDTFPIAYELYGAHHWLALGYFKSFARQADAQADEQRGEQMLNIAVMKQRQKLADGGFSIAGDKIW